MEKLKSFFTPLDQNVVWRLEPVPIWDQVAQLVSSDEFAEALNLLDCLPDSIEKNEKKRELNVQVRFLGVVFVFWFSNVCLKSGECFFGNFVSELRVFRQFAFHCFHLGQHEAALDKFLSLKEDPLRVLGLFPSMLPPGVIDKNKFKVCLLL